MQQFLVNHIRKICIISILYVLGLIVFVMPTNYAVIAPGGLTNLSTSFEIDDYEMDDHFYSIYVYSQDPITVFQYLILQHNEKYEISEISQRQSDTSILDGVKQGNISKIASYKTAIIKSYELASDINGNVSIEYDFLGLTIYDYPRRINDLSIGDLIIAIDGQDLSPYNFNDAKTLAYNKDVTYTIKKSNGDIFDYHYQYEEDDLIFWFFPEYEIIQASPSYDYDQITTIGGSSGGMLQTLSIYVSLLELNIPDIKIAGTGTIEMDGRIGKIGGIRQKIVTADRENVDVFFIPKSHLDDIEGLTYDYQLIPVETIDEAVTWLNENII